MTRFGLSLAKSRRPFADTTGSPVMKATAVGPLNRSSSVEIPASLAAILVSVFFTTAYWASSPSERRSVLSCATVRPRYSVSTAAFELRNWSASSATAAALSGLAISVASFRVMRTAQKGPQQKRPGAGARGVALPDSSARWAYEHREHIHDHLRGSSAVRILRSPRPLASTWQRPAVFGFSRRVREGDGVKQIRPNGSAGGRPRGRRRRASALLGALHHLG